MLVLQYGLCAALAILSVLDVLTTRRILANGGRELNPVVKAIMSVVGEYWYGYKILVLAGAVAAVAYYPSPMLAVALAVANLATGWAVFNNYSVIVKQAK